MDWTGGLDCESSQVLSGMWPKSSEGYHVLILSILPPVQSVSLARLPYFLFYRRREGRESGVTHIGDR